MMTDYRCPYCGCEIEDPEWWDYGSSEYEVECPECEREFKVLVETEPVFWARIPKELESCAGVCCAWEPDMDGYCGYEGLGYHDQESCPLGHERKRRRK